jgi:nucleotide-binding universal stress UspA family protein
MFKRILVPIDGSRTAEAGLRTALRLAREHKSRVRLVHLGQVVVGAPYPGAGLGASELFEAIERSGKRLLERAAARCKAAGVRCERQLYVAIADRAADVILKEARRWRADLIVMGTHGRGGIARLALGSDAEQVVHGARVPVLLVRAPAG